MYQQCKQCLNSSMLCIHGHINGHSWFSVSFEHGNENGIDSRLIGPKRWAEVNDAIAYIDYRDGKDASDRIFCLWKEKTDRRRRRWAVILWSLSPPELISFSTSSCSNSLLLTDCQKSRWQKCQLSYHMFFSQVKKYIWKLTFPGSRFILIQANKLKTI